jgi:N-acetyl-1-D-myo-inositol-2-amino-2-deoxy-alpha-D-glucopyranoside deacetylase
MSGLEVFGRSVVFAHAHPDDESISTGATIAALVTAGAHVTLVTGTRGERGEVVPGELSALEGTPLLAPHRERELAVALETLGVTQHVFLGTPPARASGMPDRIYADSGMRWGDDGYAQPADDAPAGALSLAPLAEVAADLREAALAAGAQSIVSYDALGGYGHADHVRMHDASLAVARQLGLPFFAIIEPRAANRGGSGSGRNADVAIDSPSATAAKARAMTAHRSQLTVHGVEFTLSGGQRHPIARIERFRRVR